MGLERPGSPRLTTIQAPRTVIHKIFQSCIEHKLHHAMQQRQDSAGKAGCDVHRTGEACKQQIELFGYKTYYEDHEALLRNSHARPSDGTGHANPGICAGVLSAAAALGESGPCLLAAYERLRAVRWGGEGGQRIGQACPTTGPGASMQRAMIPGQHACVRGIRSAGLHIHITRHALQVGAACTAAGDGSRAPGPSACPPNRRWWRTLITYPAAATPTGCAGAAAEQSHRG